MKRYVFLLVLVMSLPVQAVQDSVMSPQDFAWGLSLTPKNDKPFYSIELPLEVYRGVQSDTLADVRVFNARGEVVPHELKSELEAKYQEQVEDVTLFPVYARKEADAGTLTLKIQKEIADGQIALQARGPLRGSEEVLRAYILALPELIKGESYRGLELSWPQPERTGFVQVIEVESSSDLEHWRSLTGGTVILDLRQGSETLRKNSLSLYGLKGRYLRITSNFGPGLMTLNHARVHIGRGIPQVRVDPTLRMDTYQSKDDPGAYLFELPGPVRVKSIQILPQDTNTYVQVRLYSRASQKQPWRQRTAGRVYRPEVRTGGLLDQTVLSLPGIQDRYWKLEADDSGGGFGNRPPYISVYWRPHTLLFSARGGGPFTLAWGSRRAGRQPAASAGLFNFQKTQGENALSTRVVLGAPYELGGESALTAAGPADWKRWLLWGLLGLSVLLLGWMAWRTLRQISVE